MTSTILQRTPKGGKWVLARPFAKLPHDIAADPRLLPIDVRLLLALVFFARDKDTCWPSDTTLGARIARSRPTVQRRLRHLESLGLIAREKCEANLTGRLLRLRWRTDETPPVSRPSAPPAPPVRHELQNGEKDSSAPPSGGQTQRLPAPTKPMTADEVRAHYAAAGWLDKPEGDPLRRLAERRLTQALKAAQEALEPSRARPPGVGGATPGRCLEGLGFRLGG